MAVRFKLESVLKHRKHLEENAHKDFSESHRKWDHACNTLAIMTGNRRQYQQELKTKMKADTAAGEMLLYHRYLGRLEKEIEVQKGLVEGLAVEKEEKRAQLLTALKNRKIIENLKERFFESEANKANAQEKKQIDEAAVSRHQAGKRLQHGAGKNGDQGG